MQIVKISISNFRCIKLATLYPTKQNCFLGPNNVGKTAILDALNLLLNPELSFASRAVDENDFFDRKYLAIEGLGEEQEPPSIRIEAVISSLTEEDEDYFRENVVPWDPEQDTVIESSEEGEDAFSGRQIAIRVVLEAWYDSIEDDFVSEAYFLREVGTNRQDCARFSREHKRRIGFLIYRDFRALTRPITLENASLFGILLKSQDSKPKRFEGVLNHAANALAPLDEELDFSSLLSAYQAEFQRYLSIGFHDRGSFRFQLGDQTRNFLRESSQLHTMVGSLLPLQTMGAGTRSLAILAMLTLIMRRRGRGILALEEPETFLFPHAQRRVLDECLQLADQLFVTTHSPFVLERIPYEGIGRLLRDPDGVVTWRPIPANSAKEINHYSRTLHQIQSEVLVGKGVVLVEGESDRWWILGASRILNRTQFGDFKLESLELLGVSVVAVSGHGEIQKHGQFYTRAGIPAIGLTDALPDSMLPTPELDMVPSLAIRQAGLERLLALELPIQVLRDMLTQAPHSLVPLKSLGEVAQFTDEAVRAEAFEFLVPNKGSHEFHEWLISNLDSSSIPLTLRNAYIVLYGFFSGIEVQGISTLL